MDIVFGTGCHRSPDLVFSSGLGKLFRCFFWIRHFFAHPLDASDWSLLTLLTPVSVYTTWLSPQHLYRVCFSTLSALQKNINLNFFLPLNFQLSSDKTCILFVRISIVFCLILCFKSLQTDQMFPFSSNANSGEKEEDLGGGRIRMKIFGWLQVKQEMVSCRDVYSYAEISSISCFFFSFVELWLNPKGGHGGKNPEEMIQLKELWAGWRWPELTGVDRVAVVQLLE